MKKEMMEKETSSKKIEQIIQVAQSRFAMFGMGKTTMKEIAADLGMTKGSLYYYFQDKEQLYLEVIRREFNEFLTGINEKLAEQNGPEDKLTEYVKIRMSFFRSFINLSRFRMEGVLGLKSIMHDFWLESRGKEIEIIQGILQQGVQEDLLEIEDTAATASLFMDLLKGLRIMSLRFKKFLLLDEEEFGLLIDKSVSFTRIFIRGLKKQS